MANGDCPVGAKNGEAIRSLSRTCDSLRDDIKELEGALTSMAIDEAVSSTQTKLLLVGLPGVGSIIGGIITAIVMRALGA